MNSKQSIYIQGIKTVGYRPNLAKEKKIGGTETLVSLLHVTIWT